MSIREKERRAENSERNSRIYWARVRGRTFDAIAQEFGRTREGIRQICAREKGDRRDVRLRQERAWLQSQGLEALIPATCARWDFYDRYLGGKYKEWTVVDEVEALAEDILREMRRSTS